MFASTEQSESFSNERVALHRGNLIRSGEKYRFFAQL
jgi:hypothetical protein